jgi:mRNA-degrading endonuclease RelE of RelBE toxin-antitoxin system
MKRFQIRFTPEASRLVSRLSPETKQLIKDALKTLQKNPFLGDDLHEELAGFKSFKPKRYRILYAVDEEKATIDIYHIGHRRDVYEQFRLLLDDLNKPL